VSSNSLRATKTIVILTYVALVMVGLVYSRIVSYSLAPTMTQAQFGQLPWWQIPFAYLWDYISHAWICLLFAFTFAGLISEFMPRAKVMKYLSSKRASAYLFASVVAPFFTVCSCTMVPIFGGILFAGSGIGPAMALLLAAPAINILTILLTGEMISWNIATARIAVSVVAAVTIGAIISKTAWGRAIEEKGRVQATSDEESGFKEPLDARLMRSLESAWFLARRVLPFLILGIVAVSYVQAFLPEEVVVRYLTGVSGIFLASVIGGPLYTPTLVEVVLTRGLLNLGMSKAAALSFLMGQPYDIPNMLATSRIVGWKVVGTYAALALLASILGGFAYGFAVVGI